MPLRPRARRLRCTSIALAVTLLLAGPTRSASAAEPAPGSAGTDTSLAPRGSQVTVSGRGPFADLRITVNQTRNLVNQAVSVTWEGGTPTRSASARFHGHYLQLMQCWGDNDGTVPGNPGPPPEQCVQGATTATSGGVPNIGFPSGSFASERIVSRKSWPNFGSTPGYLDDRTGLVWKPFRAVKGASVDVHKDPTFNPAIVGGDFWLNSFFNIVTTNEIVGARTGPNGKGAEIFQVTTGVESSGLGCGQLVEPVDGGLRVPKCSLVIVPRGSPAEENAGTPFAEDADQFGVVSSPLSPQAWQHRIAIPLEFNPVDTPCRLGDDQRRIVGTELVVPAISSWQPKLCAAPGSPPYAYSTVSDAGARQQLLTAAPGAPGMIVVSRPIDPTAVAADKPITYAPVSVSATVIGFNVERTPKLTAEAAEQALSGVRVAEINLTPRLLAKLLTQSYGQQVAIKQVSPHEWVKGNPAHLGRDPDFLQFNPEFELLDVRAGKNFGGLLLPARNSDAARQVWEYALADPEAKAWLDGSPDPWGMKVNPVYATAAAANPAGAAFGDPPPDTYPKSDPYCYEAPPQGPDGSVIPPPLCGNDWLPYTQSLRDAARLTRAADDGARVVDDPFALSADQVYKRDVPQTLGSRAILSIVDSPSAVQFGLQTARLSRAGDNGADRTFIAPDAAAMTAGVESMAPRDEPAVAEPDPAAVAPSAYPLTVLTYAAIAPLGLDDRAREEYAAFVDYAAGPGQEPGPEIGQLPRGYAPMSPSLRAQATAAARTIRELEPTAGPVGPVPTRAASGSQPGTTSGSVSSSSGSSAGASGRASTVGAATTGAGPGPAPAQTTPTPPAPTTPTTAPRSTLLTPVVALAANRFVMPALFGIAVLSALGALEIAKRPRNAPGRPSTSGAIGSKGPSAVVAARLRVVGRWAARR